MVVQKRLADAREKNGYGTTITDEASTWISQFSDGYPHFIQQFAYCAFEMDTDKNIDRRDVVLGSFEKDGALHQLG